MNKIEDILKDCDKLIKNCDNLEKELKEMNFNTINMGNMCTNINQSKHLIDLGLSVDFADMWWNNNFYPDTFGSPHGYITPAWSFDALVDIIKESERFELHLRVDKNGIFLRSITIKQYLEDSTLLMGKDTKLRLMLFMIILCFYWKMEN